MTHYRMKIHYNLKKGMERQALEMIEKELSHHVKEHGWQNIELLQPEKNQAQCCIISLWNNPKEAEHFYSKWSAKETELVQFYANPPKTEMFKVIHRFNEKASRAA